MYGCVCEEVKWFDLNDKVACVRTITEFMDACINRITNHTISYPFMISIQPMSAFLEAYSSTKQNHSFHLSLIQADPYNHIHIHVYKYILILFFIL